MKILSAAQIKEWDDYTIQHEPVLSIDLMERAAKKCADWILARHWKNASFKIFCGKGNNGGDGLAIARLLWQQGYKISIYIIEFGKPGTENFQINLQRLHELPFTSIHFIQSRENFPSINADDIFIEALFGSGLKKPLDGLAADLVEHINKAKTKMKIKIVSIDLPSGIFADQSSLKNIIVKADFTLSFQCYKTALLVQENAPFIGELHLLDIGLDPAFPEKIKTGHFFLTSSFIRKIFQPRNDFAHKGNFGHALLIAGSYGKMGAAILAAKACLHSGVGLLSCYLPKCGYTIMQTAVPEAMVMTDANENIIAQLPDEIEKYSVIGIGPGIGTAEDTQKMISFIIRRYHKPLVIDADGLNCLALHKDLLSTLPSFSVITPHPKEFDRLFGDHQNDFERIEKTKQKAAELNIIIVLKSHHTLIALPNGKMFFNSTGNSGMAKGGSGDVLTGIITSLVSQHYTTEHAALLGVYLHGLAGDFAAHKLGRETMTATDLIDHLPEAFLQLK